MKHASTKLSPLRRELMLRVIDGRPELPPIIFQFLSLRRCDDVLAWLVANNITGLQFIHWFNIEAAKSPLEAMKLVLAKINKEAQRPVLAGRDYITD